MAYRLNIVKGPDRYDLFTALSNRHLATNPNHAPVFWVKAPPGMSRDEFERAKSWCTCHPDVDTFGIQVKLVSLERAKKTDGSWNFSDDHAWNFVGYESSRIFVRGFYDARTREGWIIVETPKEAVCARLTRAARELDTHFFCKDGTVRMVSRDLPCQEFFKALGWPSEEEMLAAEKAGLI